MAEEIKKLQEQLEGWRTLANNLTEENKALKQLVKEMKAAPTVSDDSRAVDLLRLLRDHISGRDANYNVSGAFCVACDGTGNCVMPAISEFLDSQEPKEDAA